MMEDSIKSTIWTSAENKLFENALAKFDKDTPDRWRRVAEMVPGKMVADIIRRYKELEDDVCSIEAGVYPKYVCNSRPSFTIEWGNGGGFDGLKSPSCGGGGKSCSAAAGGRHVEQERKKGVPWTAEEHKLFLLGLNKYGKGDWRNISRNFVITRTPTQVASHAQKYFLRQLSGRKDKRRASIHDITIVNLNDDHIPSPENERTSPEQCKYHPNQPNNGCAAMVFNQTHENLLMQGGNLQRSGGDAGGAPQEMVFPVQPAVQYPLR